MTDPNEKQIAGDHYSSEFQHWDLVCSTRMHYLLGCATKYVFRHRKKNGTEDLQKAVHYLEKYISIHNFAGWGELPVEWMSFAELMSLVERFCDINNLTVPERAIMRTCLMATNPHHIKGAIELIRSRLLPDEAAPVQRPRIKRVELPRMVEDEFVHKTIEQAQPFGYDEENDG